MAISRNQHFSSINNSSNVSDTTNSDVFYNDSMVKKSKILITEEELEEFTTKFANQKIELMEKISYLEKEKLA